MGLLRQEREANAGKMDRRKGKKRGKKTKKKGKGRTGKGKGGKGKMNKRKRKGKKDKSMRKGKGKGKGKGEKAGNRNQKILCCCKTKENCIEKPDLDATVCVEKICLKDGEKICPKKFFECKDDKPTPKPP